LSHHPGNAVYRQTCLLEENPNASNLKMEVLSVWQEAGNGLLWILPNAIDGARFENACELAD